MFYFYYKNKDGNRKLIDTFLGIEIRNNEYILTKDNVNQVGRFIYHVVNTTSIYDFTIMYNDCIEMISEPGDVIITRYRYY
ncbi:MAG: hypothetical protein N4A44_00540 [Alphaproteobacteria bacterium]|jgi:hypothetical protein|nr:hypothetical protein [Alphaproteobacteria bacterium]